VPPDAGPVERRCRRLTRTRPAAEAAPRAGPAAAGIEDVVASRLPLRYGLNAVNRSMGKGGLYPFVLTPAVVAKPGAVPAAGENEPG
jgi:hypothetical protein